MDRALTFAVISCVPSYFSSLLFLSIGKILEIFPPAFGFVVALEVVQGRCGIHEREWTTDTVLAELQSRAPGLPLGLGEGNVTHDCGLLIAFRVLRWGIGNRERLF